MFISDSQTILDTVSNKHIRHIQTAYSPQSQQSHAVPFFSYSKPNRDLKQTALSTAGNEPLFCFWCTRLIFSLINATSNCTVSERKRTKSGLGFKPTNNQLYDCHRDNAASLPADFRSVTFVEFCSYLVNFADGITSWYHSMNSRFSHILYKYLMDLLIDAKHHLLTTV